MSALRVKAYRRSPCGPVHALLLLLAIASAGCTNLVFHPMRPHVFDPATRGIAYEDRSFPGDDGVVLHGWWLPARPADGDASAPGPKGTVLFLHGNAENISTHVASVAWLPAAGYNVYLYDYRGFGKSGGKPDYAASRDDLLRAIAFVRTFDETRDRPLFVFGQSLGGAIALSALGGHPSRLALAGLVVEGAPASLRLTARQALDRAWLTWPFQYPLSLLISDRDSPRERIGQLAPLPLLLVHSRDDRVVQPMHGDLLRELAPEGTVWLAARGPHIAAFVPADMRQALLGFLAAPPSTRAR